jgi:hypothetical protein
MGILTAILTEKQWIFFPGKGKGFGFCVPISYTFNSNGGRDYISMIELLPTKNKFQLSFEELISNKLQGFRNK